MADGSPPLPSPTQAAATIKRHRAKGQASLASFSLASVSPGAPGAPATPSSSSSSSSLLLTVSHQEQMDRLRASFESISRLLYRQMTEGCGDPECRNSYCASAFHGKKKSSPDIAALMSIQLASVLATTQGPGLVIHLHAILCLKDIAQPPSPSPLAADPTPQAAPLWHDLPGQFIDVLMRSGSQGHLQQTSGRRKKSKPPQPSSSPTAQAIALVPSPVGLVSRTSSHSLLRQRPFSFLYHTRASAPASTIADEATESTSPGRAAASPSSAPSSLAALVARAAGRVRGALSSVSAQVVDALQSILEREPEYMTAPVPPPRRYNDPDLDAPLPGAADSTGASDGGSSGDALLSGGVSQLIESILSTPEALIAAIPKPIDPSRPIDLKFLSNICKLMVSSRASGRHLARFVDSLTNLLVQFDERRIGDEIVLASFLGPNGTQGLGDFADLRGASGDGRSAPNPLLPSLAFSSASVLSPLSKALRLIPSEIQLSLSGKRGVSLHRVPGLFCLLSTIGFLEEIGGEIYLKLLCRICASLSDVARARLVHWLSISDVNLELILACLQRHLSRQFAARTPSSIVQQLPQQLFDTCRTIAILHDAAQEISRLSDNVLFRSVPAQQQQQQQQQQQPCRTDSSPFHTGWTSFFEQKFDPRVEQSMFHNVAIIIIEDVRLQLLRWRPAMSTFSSLPSLFKNTLKIMQAQKFAADSTDSLVNYPFLFGINMKIRYFQYLCMAQMCVRHTSSVMTLVFLPHIGVNSREDPEAAAQTIACDASPYFLLEVRREHMIADALRYVKARASDLRKPLKVRYVHSGEEGVDLGGVQKECLQMLSTQLLSPNMHLFVYDEEARMCSIDASSFSQISELGAFVIHGVLRRAKTTIPSLLELATGSDAPPASGSAGSAVSSSGARTESARFSDQAVFQMYELFGVVLGLALYNSIVLHLSLPTWFFRKLIARAKNEQQEYFLRDLQQSHPSLVHGFLELLAYGDNVEDAFSATFQIMEDLSDGRRITVDLVPDAENVSVTNENRDEYVGRYMHHIMSASIERQFEAIAGGFFQVVEPAVMKLFEAEELQLMLCGEGVDEADFKVLAQNATYEDGYTRDHPLMVGLWDAVVNDYTLEERRRLLRFVTGSDRVPLGGLGSIKFIVQRNGTDSERLPTAMTCFSRLLIPEYSSVPKMLAKLKTSLSNTEGFGLV